MSQKSRNSGFTLVELLVVMAIVAILATAGVSTYSGYIKQSRDTARLSDINLINAAIVERISTIGSAPSLAELKTALAKNGLKPKDPSSGSTACLSASATGSAVCDYYYQKCDSGAGYVLRTRFESSDQAAKYTANPLITTNTTSAVDYANPESTNNYDVGNCNAVSTTLTDVGVIN